MWMGWFSQEILWQIPGIFTSELLLKHPSWNTILGNAVAQIFRKTISVNLLGWAPLKNISGELDWAIHWAWLDIVENGCVAQCWGVFLDLGRWCRVTLLEHLFEKLFRKTLSLAKCHQRFALGKQVGIIFELYWEALLRNSLKRIVWNNPWVNW